MATIITKNSSTASSVPAAGSLQQGELAVNVTDKKLYTKNSSGTVVIVGQEPLISGTNIKTLNGQSLLGSGDIATTNGDVTLNGTQTLTNKTISGSSNTLTNISLTTSITGTLPVANGGTGATSLTANNVILGNGTSAVQVVAPGSSGNVLTSNGTTWTSAANTSGKAANVQTFNSSGTWTKPSGFSSGARVLVQCWGGGGSGGSGGSVGGGGGGGAYNYAWLNLSALGSTETITIGSGGAAVTGAAGNPGGTTSVGTKVYAYGGGGGPNSGTTGNFPGAGGGGQLSSGSAPNSGKPRAGSEGNGGDNNTSWEGYSAYYKGGGGGGSYDGSFGNPPGAGGASVWGGGGGGGATPWYSPAGGDSSFGGAGGAGGASGGTAGTAPGGAGGGSGLSTAASGAGAAGRVIITVFDGA